MTYSPKAIAAVYPHLEAAYASADRTSGIAADKPGYHNSRNELRRDNRHSDYSIQLDPDLLGDGDAANGLDCKFNTRDMITVSKRMMAASKAGDPRLKGKIREWFGTIDGRTVTGFSLYRDRVASSDSSHLWHLHVSGYRKFANDERVWLGIAEVACGLAPGTLTKPTYLPVYLVDPLKVTTGLIAHPPAGKEPIERPPLYPITTGVKIIREGGYEWLVTAADRSYRLDHLVLKSEYEKRVADATTTKIRVASYNILGDKAGIAGGEGPLAGRLPAIIATIKQSQATVLCLQECNRDAAILIQGELGPDWVWSRVGTRTVMVDKAKWVMGEEKKVPLPSPHLGSDKTFPLVQLTHIRGDVIWVASGHFVSSAGNDATDEQIDEERRLAAAAVVAAARPLEVFVGGFDLNTYSLSKGKAKPVLEAGGLQLLTRSDTFDSAHVDSHPNTKAGGQQIDDIVAKGCTFLDGDLIEGTGSDHNLLVAKIELPKG